MKYLSVLVLSFLVSCTSVDKKTDTKINIKEDKPANNLTTNIGEYYLSEGNLYTSQGAKISRIFYFDYDSYKIPIRYQRDILAHIKFTKNSSDNIKIRLEGHADERGSREYNLALGEQRARSVSGFIEDNGGTEYEVVSFGEERPQDDGDDKFALSRNRRVELIYYTDK